MRLSPRSPRASASATGVAAPGADAAAARSSTSSPRRTSTRSGAGRVRDTIDDFLPETMRGNFALFEKYPDYVFSFEGAFHYALMKEYYPAEWERLKGYVKAGRWKVAGSWVDAADTHVPSPESLVRQALYGNGFFRKELGVTSRDVFLPDCFGFSFALPSVAAHCGLTAFSTQKLTWGAAMKIPFDVGLWEGVDGSSLLASINPGDYASELKGNLVARPRRLRDDRPAGGALGSAGGDEVLRDGRRRRAAARAVRRVAPEEPRGPGAAEGAKRRPRPARAGPRGPPLAGGARAPPALPRRAPPHVARRRLLHVAGGDEGVQPDEPAPRRSRPRPRRSRRTASAGRPTRARRSARRGRASSGTSSTTT